MPGETVSTSPVGTLGSAADPTRFHMSGETSVATSDQ